VLRAPQHVADDERQDRRDDEDRVQHDPGYRQPRPAAETSVLAAASPVREVKHEQSRADTATMVTTHMEWGDMLRYGIAAGLFLLLFARLLMRGS
jgi:hypothetical protein